MFLFFSGKETNLFYINYALIILDILIFGIHIDVDIFYCFQWWVMDVISIYRTDAFYIKCSKKLLHSFSCLGGFRSRIYTIRANKKWIAKVRNCRCFFIVKVVLRHGTLYVIRKIAVMQKTYIRFHSLG